MRVLHVGALSVSTIAYSSPPNASSTDAGSLNSFTQTTFASQSSTQTATPFTPHAADIPLVNALESTNRSVVDVTISTSLSTLTPISTLSAIRRRQDGDRVSGVELIVGSPNSKSYLREYIDTDPQLGTPDEDYFRLSDENVKNSGVDFFYAYWTLLARDNPEWESLGEWRLFMKTFANNYNFDCAPKRACRETVNLLDLKALYPNDRDRPLRRLVYFTQLRYAIFHDYNSSNEDVMDEVYNIMLSHAETVVAYFTKQPDPKNAKKCAIIKAGVEIGIQLAVQVAGAALGAFALPQTVVMGKGFTESIEVSFKTTYNKIAQFVNSDAKLYKLAWQSVPGAFEATHDVGKGIWKSRPIQQDLFSIAHTNVFSWARQAYEMNKDNGNTKDFHFKQGYSKSLLCGAFEGESADNLDFNTKELRMALQDRFETMKTFYRNLNKKYYRGFFEAQNFPSNMGMAFMQHIWEGPDSLQAKMHELDTWKLAMEKSMFNEMISKSIGADGGYLKCTHNKAAEKMCLKGPEETLDRKFKDKAYFCPRNETEPNLICFPGKWYWDKFHPHETRLPALDSFESFPRKLNMSRVDMMKDAYENYKTYGNAPTSEEELARNPLGPGAFRIPVCENDFENTMQEWYGAPEGFIRPRLEDKIFPAFCGDFRGNETREFMDSIGAGIGSEPYKNRAHGIQKLNGHTWMTEIPRTIFHLNPYSRYMAFGQLGLQFPARNVKVYPMDIAHNKHRFFTGIDKDFEHVKSATAEMDLFQSNIWFCKDKSDHTVFDRERSFGDILSSFKEPERTRNHRKVCKEWKKQNHKKIKELEDNGGLAKLTVLEEDDLTLLDKSVDQ